SKSLDPTDRPFRWHPRCRTSQTGWQSSAGTCLAQHLWMPGRVRIGISAWTEKTLVESGWYPPEAHRPAARLAWYATRCPLAEKHSTYYAIPTRRTAERWRDGTPAGFTMNVKAHALLTEHYTAPKRLPADLRESLGPTLRAKPRIYPKDVGEA